MPRTASPTDQEQVYQSDHDVLLELRADFRNFKDQVTLALRDVKESLDSQHANMNARLIILETFVTKTNLEERVKDWNDTSEWVKDWRKRWKLIATLIGISSGAFVYFIDHILPLISFKKG